MQKTYFYNNLNLLFGWLYPTENLDKISYITTLMRGNFFYKKLGERIAQIRKSKKLSQYELADAAKINRNYLAMVELGRANPSVKFLRKLAIAMQIKIEKFLKNL